jgi:hypothetical protein
MVVFIRLIKQLRPACSRRGGRNGFSVGVVVLGLVVLIAPNASRAHWQLDVEVGPVFSGYNDVRIPNETGTEFSLSDDLKTDVNIVYRTRLTYEINDRHALSLLLAPLRLDASGQVNRNILFEGEQFPAATPLEGTYRFDSYRLTYRYGIYRGEKTNVDVGFTAKIRDAAISLSGGGKAVEKANTGFVPLIHFKITWEFAARASLLFEGDALAAPQGRAEDVLLAVHYRPAERIGLKAGYRVLEGGADVDEVYNFALLHYLVFGVIVSF